MTLLLKGVAYAEAFGLTDHKARFLSLAGVGYFRLATIVNHAVGSTLGFERIALATRENIVDVL